MSDRDPTRGGRIGRRLDEADFASGPYETLPKRKRARRRIDSPIGELDPEVPQARPRRMTRSERRAYQERYRQSSAIPPLPPRMPQEARRGRNGWYVRLGGLVAVSLVLVTLGSNRFFGVGQEATPFPTPTPTLQALAAVTPTATVAGVIPTETPLGDDVEPTATPTPNPNYAGKVVCLDVGHGGSDRGFSREGNEFAPAMEEAYYNLAYARAVAARLETHGFTVVLTRNSDTDVNASGEDVNGDGKTGANQEDEEEAKRAAVIDELQARINVCNDAGADLLVSMHINGFDDPSANGYETWYSTARPFTDKNKRFAELAYEELGRQMELAGYNATGREVNDDATAHVELGHDAFDRYVITGPAVPGQVTPSAMPGAIVEVLFISNDQDAAFIASNEGRNAIVTAYERAIVRYFDETSE